MEKIGNMQITDNKENKFQYGHAKIDDIKYPCGIFHLWNKLAH